jgi:hypothetical protein
MPDLETAEGMWKWVPEELKRTQDLINWKNQGYLFLLMLFLIECFFAGLYGLIRTCVYTHLYFHMFICIHVL